MRTLCINLKIPQESSSAEAFLALSPRVQYRFPNFIFVEVESTQYLFGGEKPCLEKALSIALQFSREATAAIADTPPIAQLLAKWRPGCIAPRGKEHEALRGLGLDALKELEGLQPWSHKKSVDHMIAFFYTLGVHSVEEVYNFRLNSLRERWGELGALLWNRLHSQDIQVISPLVPRDPLVGYGYFDDPIGAVPLLMAQVRLSIDRLFARLTGLSRYAHRMDVVLYCEYSDKKISLCIEPVSPSRDQNLFEDLLTKKLTQLTLENPIREFEVLIFDVPEKTQQLDFFEPRDNTEDRWRRLISFAKQSQCDMGFLQIEASHFPENSFRFVTDWPEDFKAQDLIERQEEALQVKTVYAKGLASSPRPSLLLEKPQALSQHEVQQLQFMSSLPSERIESSWWQVSSQDLKNRDYFFALSHQGQLLWVFRDRINSQVYLHGYFD
jgi:protein ImuB